jgi:hypothetical protein
MLLLKNIKMFDVFMTTDRRHKDMSEEQDYSTLEMAETIL